MAPIAVQQAGAPAPASADEHVFLIGRPPLSEYLGYIETQTLEGQTAARAAWADRWRAANDHIHQLEQDEAGWADKPPITPLEDDLIPLRDEVLNDPITRQAFGTCPLELAMVELDRLVVFQKQINVRYVHDLHQLLGPSADAQGIFRFCLPFDRRYDPPVRWA